MCKPSNHQDQCCKNGGDHRLSLAHERACGAQLARVLEQLLAEDQLSDLEILRSRFAPNPASLPLVHVQLASLSDYEALLNCDTEVGGVAVALSARCFDRHH